MRLISLVDIEIRTSPHKKKRKEKEKKRRIYICGQCTQYACNCLTYSVKATPEKFELSRLEAANLTKRNTFSFKTF